MSVGLPNNKGKPMLVFPRELVLLIIVVSVIALIYFLGPILAPFLIGAAIAYLGNPLVEKLQRRGLSRTWAVSLVFTVFGLLTIALVLIIIPLLLKQIELFEEKAPQIIDWGQEQLLPWLQDRLNLDKNFFDPDKIKQMLVIKFQSSANLIGPVLEQISKSSLMFLSWIASLVLIPVVAFYLMRDWNELLQNIRMLLPKKAEARVVYLAQQCDEVLGAFLRGQFLVMISLGTVYASGLALVGLDLAFLIGLLSGLASIVPYLGFIVGIIAASIAALFQFNDWFHLLAVWGVFAVGQMIEGMILTPWLIGGRIGLHPVAVIFAILAGGQLFGFVGILLALPVAAVTVTLFRHLHQQYSSSVV